MDVMSMCSSPPNQTAPRKIPEFASLVSHAQQSLPSPPLMDMVNEKKGSPLPPITSILHSPVPPLHEINPNPLPPSIIAPKSNHDSSSDTVANHNLYHQSSSTPQSPPLRINYLQPPESISQSMAHRSKYPPPYATSLNYTSSGNNINGEDSDTPYIQQTTEQSLAKMGKVVDHCNQIAHFASQYRDMRMNYNSWNGSLVPQVNDSHLTGIVNRAYDVLNILSSLKSELTRPPSAETNQDEIDLIRKQRTLGASTRTKYRKRSKRAAPPGRCHSCNISETPEWRRGPDGARTLCNACGLRK
ncbi:12194_t:CDS:2 [Rhizophagus irregularis]|nr:12194_t:CDS:2 [Rhizophagus irregularis]